MKIGTKLLNVVQRAAATTADFILLTGLLGGGLALLVISMDSYNGIDTSAPNWSAGAALGLLPYFLVLLPLVCLLYEAILTRVWNGATVGKFLFRVRTTSLTGNLSIWQCIFRATLKVMSIMLLLSISQPLVLCLVLIAFVAVPVFTVKSQSLFDLLASTTVVKRVA